MQATSNNRTKGFTVVELLIVIVVLGILSTLIMGTLFNFYSANVTSLGKTTQDTETTAVLRSIEKELSNATSFSSSIAVSVPFGSANGDTWTYSFNDSTKPTNRVLIANSYATTKPLTDDTRMPAFGSTTAAACTTTQIPIINSAIYFAAKDTASDQYNLYRRTVVNTARLASNCGSLPIQKQTCAAIISRTTYPACAGNDAILLRGISSFSIDYYTTAIAESPITNQYLPGAEALVDTAKSVKLTVTTQRTLNGKDTPSTASIRISPTLQ